MLLRSSACPSACSGPICLKSAEIDLAGRKIYIKRDFPEFEFLYTEKQHTPPPLTIQAMKTTVYQLLTPEARFFVDICYRITCTIFGEERRGPVRVERKAEAGSRSIIRLRTSGGKRPRSSTAARKSAGLEALTDPTMT